MLSSAELCFAGPREPGGVAVGHQRAPPARQGACHETQEAPCPQAKPTRGRPPLRLITRCVGAPCHLALRLRQRSFPAWRPRCCGAPPALHPPPPPHPPTLATHWCLLTGHGLEKIFFPSPMTKHHLVYLSLVTVRKCNKHIKEQGK